MLRKRLRAEGLRNQTQRLYHPVLMPCYPIPLRGQGHSMVARERHGNPFVLRACERSSASRSLSPEATRLGERFSKGTAAPPSAPLRTCFESLRERREDQRFTSSELDFIHSSIAIQALRSEHVRRHGYFPAVGLQGHIGENAALVRPLFVRSNCQMDKVELRTNGKPSRATTTK